MLILILNLLAVRVFYFRLMKIKKFRELEDSQTKILFFSLSHPHSLSLSLTLSHTHSLSFSLSLTLFLSLYYNFPSLSFSLSFSFSHSPPLFPSPFLFLLSQSQQLPTLLPCLGTIGTLSRKRNQKEGIKKKRSWIQGNSRNRKLLLSWVRVFVFKMSYNWL